MGDLWVIGMFKHYKKVYIEEDLPEACLGCVFMGVDNKLWAGKELGYVSTQWCDINGEHLDERWRDRRDNKCPLCKLLNEPIYDDNLPIEEEHIFTDIVDDMSGVEIIE